MMASFTYRALGPKGESITGQVDAANASAARAKLRGQGLTLMAFDANAASKGRSRSKLPLKTLTLVTRQFATLLSSGLRLEEALAVIIRGHNSKTAAILNVMRTSLTEGRSMADAMADFPAVFPAEYTASVRAGENSGNLPAVLEQLALMIESRAQNRQTLQMAMAYPALLVMVSITIIVMLMIFVVPDIVRVFTARDVTLPVLTRVLIAFSEFSRTWGMLLLLCVILVGLGFQRLMLYPRWRLRFHSQLARMPLIGKIVRKSSAAQFASTLSTLVQSGVPLVDGLQAAAAATSNLYIRDRIGGVIQAVRDGAALSDALTAAGVFPMMLLAMVESGEANGKVGPALAHCARDQQREIDTWTKAAVALVEPAILLVMGGLVMLIVLAIMLPVISMNSLAGV